MVAFTETANTNLFKHGKIPAIRRTLEQSVYRATDIIIVCLYTKNENIYTNSEENNLKH